MPIGYSSKDMRYTAKQCRIPALEKGELEDHYCGLRGAEDGSPAPCYHPRSIADISILFYYTASSGRRLGGRSCIDTFSAILTYAGPVRARFGRTEKLR